MIFKGEKTTILTNLISTVRARKLLNKGCVGRLSYVLNSDNDETRLSDISVVKEFLDVFPEELLGLPPDRQVKVSINTFSKVPPIAQPPYKMASIELNELKNLATRVTR